MEVDREAGREALRPANLRRVGNLFKPHRREVAAASTLILLNAGLGVINPLLQKQVFDRVFVPALQRTGSGQVAILANPTLADQLLRTLLVLAGLMVILPVITSALGIVQTYVTTVIGQEVIKEVRNRLYTHLQGMALKFFTATRTGEIQARLSSDVGGVQAVVTDTFSSVLSNVAILLTTVVAMWLLAPALTVLSLGLVPLFILLTAKVGNVRRGVSAETQKTVADLSALVEETLSVSGVLLTKTFGRQHASRVRFMRENSRLADLFIRQQMIGRGFFALIGTFFSVAPALVYLLAGYLLLGNHGSGVHIAFLTKDLPIGTLVAFTTLQSRLFFPIGQMLTVQIEVMGAFALFDRIFEYMDMPHEIREKKDAVSPSPDSIRGDLVLDDVGFSYFGPDGTPALESVSFHAEAGQLVALVGPSGAGKTTMTYLIPRLYDVDTGSVAIDGIDVRDMTLDSLGELIGMVTQETYLFHSTVRENLVFARPDATDDQLWAALEAAAMGDRIRELPDGLETIVGERGYRLSGGEKQRIAIARVFLKDPRILVLDEATSALDTHSERLIQAAFGKLMQGRTTVAIAHRLSTILAADQILVIRGGRIVERGTHQVLVEQPGLYRQLYLEQFAAEVNRELEPA
ncbi:MAG: ABC transporter ATP-binding protein [Candidatus Dormibacteria bacterium]